MQHRSHDPIYRAKLVLVELGGKTVPGPYPIVSWVTGLFLAFPVLLFVLAVVFRGPPITSAFLAAFGAIGFGKWVGRETGGDRRLRDLALTAYSELRWARANRAARRPGKVVRHV